MDTISSVSLRGMRLWLSRLQLRARTLRRRDARALVVVKVLEDAPAQGETRRPAPSLRSVHLDWIRKPELLIAEVLVRWLQ